MKLADIQARLVEIADEMEAISAIAADESRELSDADNDQIDRRALGKIVFGKPENLKKLTDIVWPEIRRLAETEISSVQRTDPGKIIVLEAAVLLEAGWQDIGDETWVITVERETAILRSMQRDGATREAVEQRLNSQLSDHDRLKFADRSISNNGDEPQLIDQLNVAWLDYLKHHQK